jgi:hypothetical protein
LTDVHDEQEFELRYVDLHNDRVLFSTKFNIRPPDPLQSVELGLALPTLPSDNAGTFALELLWHDEPLGAHRIIVDERPKESSHGN